MSLVAIAVLALPGSAMAGGCEVLQDVRDRAECTARAHARDAARAEVERQVAGATPAGAGSAGASHSAAWQEALDEADGLDAGALLEPRPIAAVGGLVWFLVVLRMRRRRATRRAS
jgi:hypothetical protein